MVGGLLSVSVDLAIPGILCWGNSAGSGALTTNLPPELKNLVRAVCAKAFQGGTLVAVVGVLAVVLFMRWQISAFLIFWRCLGGLYDITILANLMSLKDASTDDDFWESTVHPSTVAPLLRSISTHLDSAKQPALPDQLTEIPSSSPPQGCRDIDKADFETRFSQLSKTSSIAFAPRRLRGRSSSLFSSRPSLYPADTVTSRSERYSA